MKIVKTKNSLGGDALVLTISKVIVSLIGLLTSMLLARFRTLNEYGTYSQVIMVTDLASTIFLLGLPNSINYFLSKAETKEKQQRFMSLYVTTVTAISVLIGICLNLSLPLIIKYFENPYIKVFAYVFALTPWSSLMMNSLSNTCVIFGKTNRLLVFNIVNACTTLLVLLFAKFFALSFQVYMITNTAVQLGFAVFSFSWIYKIIGKIYFCFNLSDIKPIFKYSIPIGLASVIGTINVELDKLVIGHFFSTQEYALFAVAAKELPLTMLSTSLTAVLMPALVRLLHNGKKAEAIQKWGCSIVISFSAMALFVGGLVVFAPDVMALFYSQKYITNDSIMVFRIYSFLLLLRCTYWGIVLNSSGKTLYILLSSLITLVLNIIGNYVGYYTIGFVGPAISTVIVTTVMAVAQFAYTGKVLEINIWKQMPWKTFGKIVLTEALLGAMFWLIKYRMLGQTIGSSGSIITSVGLGVIWTMLFFLLSYKMLIKYWNVMNEK